MDKTQQRIKIAEACGWTGSEEDYIYYGFTREIPMKRIRWTPPGGGRSTLNLPDYLNDLNAMHEAEDIIIDRDLEMEYREALGDVCGQYQIIWNATAEQRAEAFRRTLGLWEKSPPHVEDAINQEREHADYMEKLQRERDGCREVAGQGYVEEDYDSE